MRSVLRPDLAEIASIGTNFATEVLDRNVELGSLNDRSGQDTGQGFA